MLLLFSCYGCFTLGCRLFLSCLMFWIRLEFWMVCWLCLGYWFLVRVGWFVCLFVVGYRLICALLRIGRIFELLLWIVWFDCWWIHLFWVWLDVGCCLVTVCVSIVWILDAIILVVLSVLFTCVYVSWLNSWWVGWLLGFVDWLRNACLIIFVLGRCSLCFWFGLWLNVMGIICDIRYDLYLWVFPAVAMLLVICCLYGLVWFSCLRLFVWCLLLLFVCWRVDSFGSVALLFELLCLCFVVDRWVG